MKPVLTIAGTDPSGGAGLHADLKTFASHGVYGMGVVTAVVAQNTCGVSMYEAVGRTLLASQLDAVFSDIFPAAVKIGMIPDKQAAETIAESIAKWRAPHIILDPVMVSTSRHRLQTDDGAESMAKDLFPLCELITPNLAEAERLCRFPITSRTDVENAAAVLHEQYGTAVLITGGHLQNGPDDFFLEAGHSAWIPGKRVHTGNTHGTGCTLSAAIAANRAKGHDLFSAVAASKEYVYRALCSGLTLGSGNGPIDHSVPS